MEYKTNWKPFDTVTPNDMNRIEGNIANSVQKDESNAGHIQFTDGETLQEKYDSGGLGGGVGFGPGFELYINADGELIAVTDDESVPLRIDGGDGYLIYMEG